MNDFQLNPAAKSDPTRSPSITLQYAVLMTTSLLCLCPSSCNVQLLEIHVRAFSTQSARIGLHVEQGVFSADVTRNAYQDMLALLH